MSCQEMRRKKAREKVKADPKGPEKHSLARNKHKTLNGKDRAWWSKGKKGKKDCSNGYEGFQKVGFRTHQPAQGAGNHFNPHRGRGKDQKGKGKEGAYPQSGFSASEARSEERSGQSWESDDWYFSLTDDSSTSATGWSCSRAYTAWMVSVPLNFANHPTHVVLDLGCTRSMGSRAGIERFQKHAL